MTSQTCACELSIINGWQLSSVLPTTQVLLTRGYRITPLCRRLKYTIWIKLVSRTCKYVNVLTHGAKCVFAHKGKTDRLQIQGRQRFLWRTCFLGNHFPLHISKLTGLAAVHYIRNMAIALAVVFNLVHIIIYWAFEPQATIWWDLAHDLEYFVIVGYNFVHNFMLYWCGTVREITGEHWSK